MIMNRTELMEIIRNGESSGGEFKRDDVHPQSLAKEIASLANLEGGCILLGVEKDGTVTGLTRPDIEEWIMNICSNNIQPPITFVRIGSTSREASREQEQRLYQASGVLRYDIKPAPGSSLKDMDMRFIR